MQIYKNNIYNIKLFILYYKIDYGQKHYGRNYHLIVINDGFYH